MQLLGLPTAAAQPTPAATPSNLETARTQGGMEVSFPADYFVDIDPTTPNALTLTNLDPDAAFATLALRDAFDTWAEAATPTLDTVQAEIRRTINLIGQATDDVPQFTLPNGTLALTPYMLDTGGGGLYMLLAAPNGRVIIGEILVDDRQVLTTLLANPQPWIAILASIRFTEPAAPIRLPRLELPNRPLTLAEMPPGSIIFVSDVLLPLPEGWEVTNAMTRPVEEAILDTITLAYNDAQALATITIMSRDGTSFVDWRNSILEVMGNALIAGAGEPTRTGLTTEDGRPLEEYASGDYAIVVYLVDLGGDKAAYILLTIIEGDQRSRHEIAQSARNLLLSLSRFERHATDEEDDA
jgi:hypothetical protein